MTTSKVIVSKARKAAREEVLDAARSGDGPAIKAACSKLYVEILADVVASNKKSRLY